MDKELEIFIGATGDKEVPIFVPGARKKRDPEKPAPSRRIDPMMFQSASDAGVASLEEGHDGLLARTEREWLEALTRLIEDTQMRRRIGTAGRKTVEERYSVDRTAPYFIKVLRGV